MVIEKDVEIKKREGEQVYIPVEDRGKLETALREVVLGGNWRTAPVDSSNYSAGNAIHKGYHRVKSSHKFQSSKLPSRHRQYRQLVVVRIYEHLKALEWSGKGGEWQPG